MPLSSFENTKAELVRPPIPYVQGSRLVRNFQPNASAVDFREFSVEQIGSKFTKLREDLSSSDVNPGDWILEKHYLAPPPGPPGSPAGGIPNDIEEVLLLLRLFRPGDISFTKLAVILPSGHPLVQFPYRAMNDLNSYSNFGFRIESSECAAWETFADHLRQSQSWKSTWFATAKRFFLSGGAKEFNPNWDDVDRIADYATALEATVVPENSFNTRRMSRRAGALLAQQGLGEMDDVARFFTKIYGIRSQIVHGGTLGDKNREWLINNYAEIELRMRQVLKAAVIGLPPDKDDRRKALSDLYDPTEDDRRKSVVQSFGEIKSKHVRKSTVSEIAVLAER